MISIDGIPDHDFGIQVLDSVIFPSIPETRQKTLEIPGRNGVWNFGADMGVRVFNIPCIVQTASQSALSTATRALASALFDSRGHPKTVKLSFDHDPGIFYNVSCTGNLQVNRLEFGKTGNFVLSLVAHDPHGYGPDVVISRTISSGVDSFWMEYHTAEPESLAYVTADGDVYMVYLPEQAGADNKTIVITNSGNVDVYPKISIKNEGVNTISGFSISGFSYIGTLAPGDAVSIDSNDFTLTKNGLNDLNNMNGDFPILNLGENMLEYSDSEADRTVKIDIEYNLRWI